MDRGRAEEGAVRVRQVQPKGEGRLLQKCIRELAIDRSRFLGDVALPRALMTLRRCIHPLLGMIQETNNTHGVFHKRNTMPRVYIQLKIFKSRCTIFNNLAETIVCVCC